MRSPLIQGTVRTVFVVVNEVSGRDLLEMASTEDEELVQTLSAGRAYESFGERIPRQGLEPGS